MDLTKPYRPENLKSKTSNGTLVRSKNEVIIFNMLTDHLGLVVKYEEPLLNIKGEMHRDFILPDFTIWYEDRVYYWEHLGLMDLKDYRVRWEEKLAWYKRNGYLAQLIISEDALTGGIYSDHILKIAKERIIDNISVENEMTQQHCTIGSSYQIKADKYTSNITFPKGLFIGKRYLFDLVSPSILLTPSVSGKFVCADTSEKDRLQIEIDKKTHITLCGTDGYARLQSVNTTYRVDQNGRIYIDIPSLPIRAAMLKKDPLTRNKKEEPATTEAQMITQGESSLNGHSTIETVDIPTFSDGRKSEAYTVMQELIAQLEAEKAIIEERLLTARAFVNSYHPHSNGNGWIKY